MKKKPVTADELMKQLEQDAAYTASIAKQDAALAEREQLLAEEEKKLIQDLYDIGIQVNSVWDLVNARYSYMSAIPVLLKHAQLSYSRRTKEGIIRALTVPEARTIADSALIKLFELESDAGVRWVIANALSVVTGTSNINNVVDILNNSQFGESRGPLVFAASRVLKDESIPVLMELLDDPDIFGVAIEALGSLNACISKIRIEKFVNNEDPYIRQKAKTALKRLSNCPD